MRLILKCLSFAVTFFLVLVFWDYFRYGTFQWVDNLVEALFLGIVVPFGFWLLDNNKK